MYVGLFDGTKILLFFVESSRLCSMVLMNLLALHLTLSTLFVMVACLSVYLSLGGIYKLCRLKIGNF